MPNTDLTDDDALQGEIASVTATTSTSAGNATITCSDDSGTGGNSSSDPATTSPVDVSSADLTAVPTSSNS